MFDAIDILMALNAGEPKTKRIAFGRREEKRILFPIYDDFFKEFHSTSHKYGCNATHRWLFISLVFVDIFDDCMSNTSWHIPKLYFRSTNCCSINVCNE